MYVNPPGQSNCNSSNHSIPTISSSSATVSVLDTTLSTLLQPKTRAPLAADLVRGPILHIPAAPIDRVDMGLMGRHRSLWVTVAVLLGVALAPMMGMAADEDPLQDFCVADLHSGLATNGIPCKPANQVSVSDFKFDGLMNAGNTNNPNQAVVTPASVLQFAGLNTLGISAARIDFAKGGINPLTLTPRATEILLVVKGELYVGFVSTNNTLFATVLNAGELFVFPKGLVHFQLNVGKGPALAFAALSSQNPGVQQVAAALFTPDIKDEVLEKAFKIDEKTVDTIQKEFRM